MRVRAYIDAAYGVHQESGKSHTGCAIVIGDGGPVYNKSTKQKIVTKSSTEAELVGLSDTASQAIHMRNFVIAQGYDVGPVIIYQDIMSCMALMKRGEPCSDRSRHINIRHFWLCEKVDDIWVPNECLLMSLRSRCKEHNSFESVVSSPTGCNPHLNLGVCWDNGKSIDGE